MWNIKDSPKSKAYLDYPVCKQLYAILLFLQFLISSLRF